MSEQSTIQRALLRLLRVSPEPDPPPGPPESIAAFRAAKGYLHYLLLAWTRRQVAAAIGIVISFFFLGLLEDPTRGGAIASRLGGAEAAGELERAAEVVSEDVGLVAAGLELLDAAAELPFFSDRWSVLRSLEYLAVTVFLIQLLTGWFLVRLRWRMRWYFVSDTALRIREGLWTVSEKTLTLANIQNTKISQGPVEKLFGISNLEVKTAGGGSDITAGHDHDLHLGVLRGLDNAHEVRARIRTALGRLRDAGLGDPDEEVGAAPLAEDAQHNPVRQPVQQDARLNGAAQRLLEASRALRGELGHHGS